MVGSGNTSRPARCVAGVQDMRLSTLRDRDCTGQYIEELVFVLVPVIVGGPCPGMKCLHVRSVLCKPSRVRQPLGIRDTEGLAFGPLEGYLILLEDHFSSRTAT
jgi:hypothetical protein